LIFMGGFSPSPTKILQRALLAALPALLIFSLLPTGFAQSNGKKTSKGPRAVAVVEWTASGPHLIPVSILVDGKFYDAGLYLANPVPMALETGNVYEIQKSGDPAGLFTVNSVMQLQASNTFYGVGKFTSQADVEAAAKKATAAKAAAAARTPSRLSSEDSGPPRLRRTGGHGGNSGSPSDSKNGPPVPQTSPQPPSSTPDSTGGDDNDPDRPTLKRPEAPPATAPTASPAPSTASTTPPTDDSDRPVLKRGSEGQQAASLTGPASPKPATPSSGATTRSATAARNRMEVAVSDPNSTAPHPFKWIGKPEYEQRDQEATRQIALQAVRDYTAKHPGLRASSLTNDLQVHAFDLDYTNTPLFVLTATVPQGSAPTPKSRTAKPKAVAAQEPVPGAPKNEFYVTVVARENYDGTMRKVFTSVTDKTHLDVYPKLELIDVVDADGSGRGELLFRQISDTSHSWVIYRVGVDTVTPLYNSGAPLEQ
jgi:hypothetical protein